MFCYQSPYSRRRPQTAAGCAGSQDSEPGIRSVKYGRGQGLSARIRGSHFLIWHLSARDDQLRCDFRAWSPETQQRLAAR